MQTLETDYLLLFVSNWETYLALYVLDYKIRMNSSVPVSKENCICVVSLEVLIVVCAIGETVSSHLLVSNLFSFALW